MMFGRILCFIGFHDWTCRAEQGIKPDPVKLRANPVEYFYEYARAYCSRCKKVILP